MKIYNTQPLIHKLIEYQAENDTNEKDFLAIELRLEAKVLAKEVTEAIMQLTEPDSYEGNFRDRAVAYNSNNNVQVLIGKTLFNNSKRLRSLSEADINSQIFTIIDRIFQLSISKELDDDDCKLLDSSSINPVLTQLTQFILSESLISEHLYQSNIESEFLPNKYFDDSNIDNDEDKPSSNTNLDVFNINMQTLANLGKVGLMTIQEKLKDTAYKVYSELNTNARFELDALLKLIKTYNPRTLKGNSLNKNLLLKIFSNELKNGYSEEIKLERKKDNILILNYVAEILSQFDLKLDSKFIEDFEVQLEEFKGKTRLKALAALSKTKFTENTNTINFIAEQMVKILTSNKTIGESNLFASQFLINNPNSAPGYLIKKLVKAISTFSENHTVLELDKIFCILVILNSWAKEARLKNLIKDSMLQEINEALSKKNSNEIFNNFSPRLLILASLLDSPKELVDIYIKHHQKLDLENQIYLATTIAGFKNYQTYIDSVKEANIQNSLRSAFSTLYKVLKNDPKAIKGWGDGIAINQILSLYNSETEKLIQQNLNIEEFRFESFFKIIGRKEKFDTLNKSINFTKLKPREVNFLIKFLSSFTTDINEYQNQPYINHGEAPTLITKFTDSSVSPEQDIRSMINMLLEIYSKIYNLKSFSKSLASIEQHLIRGLKEMGSTAEAHLVKIVAEASQNPDDTIKQRQAQLAERVLKERNYLPELTA